MGMTLARTVLALLVLVAGDRQAVAQGTSLTPTRELTIAERELLRKTKVLRLALTAWSWRSEPGRPDYDVKPAISARLAEVGFVVVPATATRYDATVAVEYREESGRRYWAGEVPAGSSTTIICTVNLIHRDVGHVAHLRVVAAPPELVISPGENIYRNAVSEFERQAELRLFGLILARALGIQAPFTEVLSAVSESLERREIVDSIPALARLPDADSPELWAALVNIAYPPDDIRVALKAVTRIGDKRVLPALRRKLPTFADDETRRMIADAIEALEKK